MPQSTKAERERVEEQHRALDGLALPRWLPHEEPPDRGHTRPYNGGFCTACGLYVPFWNKLPCPNWHGPKVTLGVEGRIAILLSRLKGISPETLVWLVRKIHERRKAA